MKRIVLAFSLSLLALFVTDSPGAMADDEITLFNSRGEAAAYIAPDDGLTIYLWSGKPVAYLERDSSGGFTFTGLTANILVGLLEVLYVTTKGVRLVL